MSEKYEIKIVMEAVSRVAPAMRSVSREADKMSAHFKAADDSIKKLDRHMVQFDGQLVKAKNTLRGMNPTLTATANKFGTLSETLTSTNRHMKSLENNAEKAGGALGGLVGVIEGLKDKLNGLDRQMTEMGAKTYTPEIEVSTKDSEASINRLLVKLRNATEKTYTATFSIDKEVAQREIERLYVELTALEQEDRFVQITTEVKNFYETKAQLKTLEEKKKVDIELSLKGEQYLKSELSILRSELKELGQEEVGVKAIINKRQFDQQRSEIYASILQLAGVDVKPEVKLDAKAFEAEYLLVEAQLTALGLKREHVKVFIDTDKSGLDRAKGVLENQVKHHEAQFDGLTRKIRDNLLGFGIVFAEPLLSALTGLVGGLVAVAASATQAALALGGLAAAGIAQALPMAGILAASLARVVGVMKAVSAAQAEKDKGAQQGGAVDLAAAGRADALKSAHEGLTNALRSQALAQEALNDARRQGIRTLTDMKLAQERANMAADESARTYAAAQGQGTGQSAQSLELQARSDRIDANRQNVDTGRAVAGGIEGLPAVQAAKRSLDDATRSVAAARRAIKQAEASFNQAASSQGAAASALAIALGKLTDSEKKLYNSVTRFRALFQKGGVLNAVTDPMVAAFADGLDKLAEMLKDPEVLGAITGLADAMGKSFRHFAKFMTTGPMRSAFITFAEQGSKNIVKLTRVLEKLIHLFVNVAKAASGIFTDALHGTGVFLDDLIEKTSGKENQDRLKDFFKGAFEQLVNILKLSGAVIKLFAALAGAGGAEEGDRGVKSLTKTIDGLTKKVNENQEAVAKFFHDAIDTTGEILQVIAAIGKALIEVFDPESVRLFADFFKDTILPVFVYAVRILGEISKIISALANNGLIEVIFKALTTWLIVGKTLGFISKIGVGLINLAALIGRFIGFDLARPFRSAIAAVDVLLAKMGRLKAAQTGAGGGVIVPGGKPGAGGTTTSPGGVIIPGGVKTPERMKPVRAPRAKAVAKGVGGVALLSLLLGETATDKSLNSAATRGGLSGAGQDVIGSARTLASGHPLQALKTLGGATGLTKLLGGRDGDKLNEFALTAENLQKKLVSLGDTKALANLAKEAKKFAKDFPEYSDALNGFADKINNQISGIKVGSLNEKLSITNDYLDLTARTAGKNLSSIRAQFKTTAGVIENELGKGTKRGKEAAQKNFELMAAAIRQSMRDGVISVRTGNREIKRLLAEQLKTMGFSEQDAIDLANTGMHGARSSRGAPSGGGGGASGSGNNYNAFGGFIGNKGERGGDNVPIWVGRGEAVLNWGHQKIVEPAMRAFYGSGLGEMFKRARGRHSGSGPTNSTMYAKGGYIQGAAGNPARGAANDLAQRMFNRGFNVTSAYRSSSNTYHGSRDALDFGDSANDLRKVWSVLSPQKSKFAELFGPAAFAGLWHGNSKFQDAELQADHEDHVHVAVLNAVGRLGNAVTQMANAPKIKRVKSNMKGALGTISQRALDIGRAGANRILKNVFDSQGGGVSSGAEPMTVSPRGGGRSVGASVFGGPADPGTGHIGYRGDDLNVYPNSFAELNMGTALGNLPYKAKLRVTGPKGSKVLYKRDIGAGGGNVQGKTRAIDLWYKAAEALGISGLGLVKVQRLAKGGYAGGLPFVGSYGSGGEIPRDGMAHVHKGEVVVPRAIAAAVKTPKLPTYKSVASRIKSATEALSTSSDFEDTNKAAKALIAALKKLSVKSKKGFEKLKKTVDTAAADGGVFDTLVGKIDKKSRARRARGLSERDTLFQERKGISATGEILDDELAQAKRILAAEEKKGRQKDKNGKRKGNKKGIANAKIAIENIRASQVDLREKFNQNVQDTVSNITETYDSLAKINDRNGVSDFAATDKLVSGLKGQLARVDSGSQFANPELAKSIRAQIADSIRGGTFNRVGTGAQLQQKKDDFLGKATTTLLDASIEATQSGIQGLRDRIANDGSDADNALREKIAELETDLVGLVADRLQKSIDAINKAAETELSKNDLTQSFAQLGITRDQAINGNYSIAGLGRTDYGTIGNALKQRGNILTNQRSGLAGQLTTAIEQGNTGAIEELTKQIEDLNLQVVDNIKAIRDNTDAAFDFTVGQKQEQNGFLLGLNQGAQAISSGLIAISGIADDATQLAILNQRQSQLTQTSKDDRGFLGALLGGFGINVGNLSSVSGNNLVPYLESLYNQGLSSGQMDDAQITAMKQLITAIIQSETALLDNTKAIKDMSSSVMQTFTSSAWTTFRQAIFDGNSGLLPQYSIPSMDTGGYVAKSGLFNLHAGEKVLRKDEVDNSHTIGEFHTHITSPTEVLDPYTIGPKIAWSLAGTGRN